MKATDCPCTTRHSPSTTVLDEHHVLPQSWGGKTEQANLVSICPTTHRNTHELLDAYVRYGGLVPASVLRRFGPFARQLAARGVQQAKDAGAWPPKRAGHGS